MKADIRDIIESLKCYIELERLSGVDGYCRAPSRAGHVPEEPLTLDALKNEVIHCTRCDLHKTKRHYVFGAGSPAARLMFVGEAPGEDEDAQGLPFVGRAGQLLTKIIEAMGLTRQDVFIANILKCRPPNNRAPLPTEILACQEYVQRQITCIRPKVICTLGKFASQTLLKSEVPISALRGTFREYGGIKVMPTFHPAYLLRNPPDKKLVWEDMKKIMKALSKD